MVPTTVPASSGDVREVHQVGTVPPRFGRRVVLVPAGFSRSTVFFDEQQVAVLADEPTLGERVVRNPFETTEPVGDRVAKRPSGRFCG